MGMFHSLVDKYKKAKQMSINKKEFKDALLKAVEDGKLSGDEISELEKRKEELGLTEFDVQGMKAEIYTSAFAAAKSDTQVTKEEEEELEKIQKYLGLFDDEITHDKKELARLRLLNGIQNGNMPAVTVSNVVLFKGEKPLWVEPVDLIEEKTIRHHYSGGSRGMSFRVMKGVSYRVGGHRGTMTAEKGLVVVSSGDMIITDKRIIMRGDRKSFAIKLNNVLGTELFTNAIYLSENGKATQRLIRFQQKGNHDIVGAVLSYAINHFEG
jgi:hypothetical protein